MPLRSNKLKMVLALLIKEITFHMQVTIVKIGVWRLERSIKIISSFDKYKWGRQDLVLDPFDTSPHKLLKKVVVRQS